MGGKDLVNMIKATMEWVDIPIVLWTREPVASQKEARQIHGADEVVPKSGGAAALVARVITVFRRASPRLEPRLVLASASPRRARILRELGVGFRVVVSHEDESLRPGEDGAAAVERLARAKAPRRGPRRRRCPCSPPTPRSCATATSWASPRTSGTRSPCSAASPGARTRW